MTSKEFYKMTSDMAFPVKSVTILENDDVIVGRIGMVGKTRADAEKIMTENNFFSFDIDPDKFNYGLASLVLEFHYGIDFWDAYSLSVCDVIDCREGGGRVVLSCNSGYKLIKEVRPEEKPTVQEKPKDAPNNSKTVFDLFDDFFNDFKIPAFPFQKFPCFPKFPDFDKILENTKDTIEKVQKNNDGKTKFYDFSCKIDPDGNVSVKRSTNDGTVTKQFNLSDFKKDDKEITSTVKELKELL